VEPPVVDRVTEYELGRVYFIVSSKHGEASLAIDHNPARQGLLLPVHPSSSVEEAAHLLYPEVAHYAEQWEKIMVDDLDRGAKGFSVPGDELPRGIAPSENAGALYDLALRHGGPQFEAWFRQPGSKILWEDVHVNPSNTWQFVHEVESINEHGITPLLT
jgi:hypothetical protein